MAKELTKSFKDKITAIAVKQFEASFNFKKNRMEEIGLNEDFYNLRDIKVPRGRFAVPLPVMSGFVDQLTSKIDEPPSSKYTSPDIADTKRLDMVTMAYDKDMSTIRANYAQKDRWAKKLACFSGRGIIKSIFSNNPYKLNLEVIDYNDFMTEPTGGGDLNNHAYHGQDNIMKTLYELKDNPAYSNVKKLFKAVKKDTLNDNSQYYAEKKKRLEKLGFNLTNASYLGQDFVKVVEWVMNFEGEKYYLVFNLETSIWIRVEKLSNITKSGLSPFTSWATHEDSNIFWSKAPCDDMRPIADTAETLLNQELYNRAKNNMGQRAFDPDVFQDPSQLAWRPDGLVEANVKPGRTIAGGIYEFQTREMRGTIDLLQFIDAYGSQKTGISSNTSQVPEAEQKVGIRFANMQDMADRLGLYNKSYRKFHDEIAQRYYYGTIENLSEKELVKMIGDKGFGWDSIKNNGTVDFDIELVGGSAELQANAEQEKQRSEALMMIMKDPVLAQAINPIWRAKQTLVMGKWDEGQIKSALSQGNLEETEIIGDAALAVQNILINKKPKRITRTATIGFLQYLIDFADNMEFDMVGTGKKAKADQKHHAEIMEYAERHMPVVEENMARKAADIISQMGGVGGGQEEKTANPLKMSESLSVEEPVAGGSGFGIKQGVEATNILGGNQASVV